MWGIIVVLIIVWASSRAFLGGRIIYNSVSTKHSELRELDTVDIIMLVCDTVEKYYVNSYCTFDTVIDERWVGRWISDTIYTGMGKHELWWRFGKEVLELYNTTEGQIDPYSRMCINNKGEIVDCYNDYWVHKEYLDELGYPLPKGWVVWQSLNK